MSWITLSVTDVKAKLAGAELTALQTAALASGQSDPVVEIIAEVTNEVRGYVAACARNTLGAGATIPDKLKSAALAMIRYRSATRLPVKSFLTADRVSENEAAVRLMEQVAKCMFAIEEPTTASDEVIAMPSPSICGNSKTITRQSTDGM